MCIAQNFGVNIGANWIRMELNIRTEVIETKQHETSGKAKMTHYATSVYCDPVKNSFTTYNESDRLKLFNLIAWSNSLTECITCTSFRPTYQTYTFMSTSKISWKSHA